MRVFEEPKAPFRTLLAFIGFEPCLRRQLGRVECIGGQDETALLRHQGLTSRHHRRQGSGHVVHHSWRLGAWPRAATLPVARCGMDRPVLHGGGLQGLCTGGEGLLGIGFTGEGGAAQLLEGLRFCCTVLESVLVHRTLGLWATTL
jgi:hypothetical protein